MEVLSGTHMELIDEEIHTALIDDIFGPDDNDDDVSKVGSPDSKPSIDFSVVTPDSQGKNTFPNESYNLPELDDAHDSFDFDDSLDLFSNQGADNDNNSVSDMSDQKAKPKKRTMKEKKEKKIRAKPAAPSFKEEEEARKAQVVESEIEVVKNLENGPSVAELRRRNLIEIDQDELEERMEKLNKVTLKVISSSLGLSKAEQLQKIIECREFLKKYWDDSELGDFIEDTLEKQNSRIYGVDTAPALNALDYLDKESYSDDDWEVPQEEGDKAEENEPVGDKTADKPVDSSSAGVNDGAVAGEGFIELSDSEDEGEGEGEGEEEGEESDTEMQATTASVVSPAPAAPAVPTLSAAELAAQAKAAQLERLKAEQEERERVELERRKERFFAAQKAPRNSRAALLTSLRLKVHQTAKENYCNQRKIQSEGLELRLEISEKCRQLVELLKEREEGRMLMKREARRAKYQQLADADEDEFDEEDSAYQLGEGQYLTAEEKAAMLKQFNDPSDEEDDENGDEQSSIASDDSQLDNHIADANDMSMGMDVVQEELEGAGMLPGDGNMSTQQVSQPSQDEDVDADEEPTQAQDGAAEEEADEEVQVTHNKRNRLSGTTESATAGGTAIHYGKVRATVTSGASMEEGEEDNLLDEPTEKQQQQQQQGEEEEEEATERNIEGADGDTGDDDASLANRTMATAKSHRSSKTTKTTKAKKSTGNALYRMALEEEERRSRRHKGNSLLDDEAAEEEEEGLQAGLGDFGFGVTSNIREHDEEMNALKVRKGDFEHIVDDVSDGEGDEAAGAQARAEMELQEDRARDRAIITAVTEGHDAMCKLTRKGKGAFSFERLVGGDSKRGGGAEGGAEGGAAVEEEEDLEELMQRGMQGRLEMERSSKARRGYHGSDSDSDSAADSDTDENLLEQLDTSDMTEEQKREEQEKHQRIQEQKRMDALMAKQRIQSYKMARERARQERLQKQLQLQQQQSGGVSGSGASAFPGSLSLMRQESTGASQYSRPAVSRTLTLEPLHDEYSRIFMNSVCDQGGASMGGTYPMMASSTSSSNLMPPTSGASSTGITPRSSATDYKLVDITNQPLVQIKRRTTQAPKHAVASDKRALRRGSTIAGTGSSAVNSSRDAGLYKSELNLQDVQGGYGMGMVMPSSTRHAATNASKAGKFNLSNGLFSAVTGIRRIGDLGKTASTTGGANGNSSSGASSNTLRKRTFSEVGKLHSTVAAQQFVFKGTGMGAGAADEGSRLGDNSSSGFGIEGLSRSASMSNAPGGAAPRPKSSVAAPAVTGSLFAQLGAKRSSSFKSVKSISSR